MGGGGISLPKVSVPKVTVKAPKITADPVKTVSKAVQGVTNLGKTLTVDPVVQAASGVIGGVGQVANAGMDTVGSVMSNPNAAGVLGVAGAAFGIPGLGSLGGLLGTGAPESSPSSSILIPQSSSGENTILILGGLGAVALLVMFMFLKKGK